MATTSKVQNRSALNWLLWGGSLVTLFIWSSLHDPFNAPKSWVLSIAGSWLFGWVVFQLKDQWKVAPLKGATVIAGAYLLVMSIDFILGNNKYISFFGEYQRRTGYISYVLLVVFFLAASYLIRLENIERLEIAVLVTGFLTAIYGFFQHFKIDFIHWNNQYNPVISTLGNPDFAAAAMSIFLIISFGISIQSKNRLWLRVFAGLNSLLLFIVIIFSQVRQGLITSVLGIVIIFIIWLYQKQKYLSYGFIFTTFLVGVISILGMLNKGPLINFFYKSSVTFRGDYWRAGWRMFVHHPIFGVGLDRYGAYFRQYRDATQSLRRGPGLVSNAAHDIPIQLAATGGILLLLVYTAMTIFIAWRGLISLKRTQGAQQLLAGTIFAAWIAYLAQSLISIDNLAIAIWGYILGGAVVGISTTNQNSNKSKSSISQPLLSGALAFAFIVISGIFWSEQSSTSQLANLPNPRNQSEAAVYKAISQKPLSFIFKEPTIEVIAAAHLAQVGDFPDAITVLKEITIKDPRNYDALDFLSRIYEYQKNWTAAVPIREAITKLDPYNQINLLQLGEDYKSSGNMPSAKGTIALINAFAPDSSEAKQALKDFGK
jgi:O-antigen ligase